MYQGESERKSLLEMSGAFCIHKMSLSWEYAPALLNTTQLFLTLKCYHKDVILGLFHFSVDKQNKQAYGHHMAHWPHISLFNPHINPTPVPS